MSANFRRFMASTNSSIKLGRVSKSIERSLSYSFPGDVFVYMSGNNLDKFAFEFPRDYLRRLEVAKDILSRPHYAAYDEKEETIYLFRTYYKNGVFKTYVIKIKREECWKFLSFANVSEDSNFKNLKVSELDFIKKKNA